jgi:hypothetical protein
MKEIVIPEQTLVSKLADMLMVPVMYVLQFPSFETTQRTHFWNNVKLRSADVTHLEAELCVSSKGNSEAVSRWLGFIPIFHMPIFGGWKKYIVLEPQVPQDIWYVGWIPGDVIGVSQIPLKGRVRVLIGKDNVFFFGINENGDQIKISQVGEGSIGERSEFSKDPIL